MQKVNIYKLVNLITNGLSIALIVIGLATFAVYGRGIGYIMLVILPLFILIPASISQIFPRIYYVLILYLIFHGYNIIEYEFPIILAVVHLILTACAIKINVYCKEKSSK